MAYYRPQRNYGCRIHDQYRYMDMRTVVLENELVRVSILADKGTEIFEYLYKPKDLDFIWLSEQGVQNPYDALPSSADPALLFIDSYPGGWQEVFPNGGPASTYLGAQFGQHTEVSLLPWDYDIVEDTPERVSVRFRVRTKRVPFELTKTLTLESGSASLLIEEQLENLSSVPLQFMWGQHLTFGKPFAGPGCRLTMPDGVRVLTESDAPTVEAPGRVKRGGTCDWPMGLTETGDRVDLSVLPAVGTPSEMIYVTGFTNQAWYRIDNEDLGMGMKVEWDGAAMPYLWYWQEYGATEGYPWYGRHYNIGLEPFSSYPTLGLEEAVRNDSAGHIGPRESRTFRMQTMPYELKSCGVRE